MEKLLQKLNLSTPPEQIPQIYEKILRIFTRPSQEDNKLKEVLQKIEEPYFTKIVQDLFSSNQFLEVLKTQISQLLSVCINNQLPEFSLTKRVKILSTIYKTSKLKKFRIQLYEEACSKPLFCLNLLCMTNKMLDLKITSATKHSRNSYYFDQLILICIGLLKAPKKINSSIFNEALYLLMRAFELDEDLEFIVDSTVMKAIQIVLEQDLGLVVGQVYKYLARKFENKISQHRNAEFQADLIIQAIARVQKSFRLDTISLGQELSKIKYAQESQLLTSVQRVNQDKIYFFRGFCELVKVIHQHSDVFQLKLHQTHLQFCQKTFDNFLECQDSEIFKSCASVFSHNVKRIDQEYSQTLFSDSVFNFIVKNCPDFLQDPINSAAQKAWLKQYLFENQGKISSFIAKVNSLFEKQYDQKFNRGQFESACNCLIILVELFGLNKSEDDTQSKNCYTIGKNDIINWLKTLLNLNESCLFIHRSTIVKSTLKIINKSLPIILPGNQYLQEVVQELFLEDYPSSRGYLDNLVDFYIQNSNTIWNQGYRNKFVPKSLIDACSYSILEETYSNNNNNDDEIHVEDAANSIPNSYMRSEKFINRIYEQLNCHELQLQAKVHLWEVVFKMHLNHKNKFPESPHQLDITDTKDVYENYPDQVLAKHLASKRLELPEKCGLILSQEQAVTLREKFEKYPQFYQKELLSVINLVNVSRDQQN